MKVRTQMGGAVAVGFRFKDGSTFVQERWTNNLPFWFKHAKLYNGDQEHLDQYIRMAEDYPKQVPLAPLGYGLVFVDYVTNHLLSMQEYTSLDREHPVHMAVLNTNDNDFSYTAARYQGLLDERRMYMHTYRVEESGNDYVIIEEQPGKLLTGQFGDLLEANNTLDAHNRAIHRAHHREFYYLLDTRPLTYLDFEAHYSDGSKQMLAKLQSLGVPLDDASLNEWNEWIKGEETDE